jgi:sulfide:quinone oxidoreductase
MKAIVIGGNFAGMTAALELKRKLGKEVEVIVIDKSPVFLFIPSLIWVPFHRREVKDISIRRDEIFRKKNVNFVMAEAISVDPDAQLVHTSKGDFEYDHLVVATGPKVDFNAVPGLKEHGFYIGTPEGAMRIRKHLDAFVKNPGPIVIGATQNAGCMGAAYEFLFNMDAWLRSQKIRKKVELTWVTPETYIGHFGIDGMTGAETMLTGFLKMFNIKFRKETAIKEVREKEVELDSGEILPSDFTMLMPPFIGVDMIRNSPALRGTKAGYLPVADTYRHPDYPNVWAAGIAVDVKPPFEAGKVLFSAPKTGYPSDETAKIAAENIVRVYKGKGKLKAKSWGDIPAICVMDAGNKEVIILGNKLFRPRGFAVMIPNLLGDVNKVLFEKYFLWKTRHGYSFLP